MARFFTAYAVLFACLTALMPSTGNAAACNEEVGRGVASWYGPGFDGALTKTEEIFDPAALSAAHPDLPMGTVVKVRNMRNNKDVVVKINDRGGFGHERVIDVSESAALQLGMKETGTAAVSIFKCSP